MPLGFEIFADADISKYIVRFENLKMMLKKCR